MMQGAGRICLMVSIALSVAAPNVARAGTASVGRVESCELQAEGQYAVIILLNPAGATVGGTTIWAAEPGAQPATEVFVDSDDARYCAKLPKGTKVNVTYTASGPVVSPASARRPSSDPLVQEVQTVLGQLGYNVGVADGVPGPRTRAAIIQFQREHGLVQTGNVSQELLDQLRGARTKAP